GKIVPLALVVGVIINADRCAKGESTICAPREHYFRGALTIRLHTGQHVNIVVCCRPGAVYRDECLATKPYVIDSTLNKKAAQINESVLVKGRCDAAVLGIGRAK